MYSHFLLIIHCCIILLCACINTILVYPRIKCAWLLSFAYHIALWLYNNCMLMIQQNYNRNTWFIYIGYELYISYCPMLKRVLSITATSVLSIHPKRIPFALPMTNTPGYHFRKVSFYDINADVGGCMCLVFMPDVPGSMWRSLPDGPLRKTMVRYGMKYWDRIC